METDYILPFIYGLGVASMFGLSMFAGMKRSYIVLMLFKFLFVVASLALAGTILWVIGYFIMDLIQTDGNWNYYLIALLLIMVILMGCMYGVASAIEERDLDSSEGHMTLYLLSSMSVLIIIIGFIIALMLVGEMDIGRWGEIGG